IECPISDEKDELGLIYSIITRILDFDKYINIKREYYNTSEDLIDLEINPDKYEEIYYPIIEKENIQKKQYKKYPEPLWLKDIFDIIEDKEREKNLLDIGYIQIEIKDLEYKIKEIEAKINLKNKIKSIEEIEEYEKFFIKEEINSKNNNKVLKILAKINKEYITQKHKNYRYLNLKKGKELKIREINIKEGTLLNIREIIELEKRYKLNKLLEL
ncbi:hypothetical protein RZS08_07730, partial [Arthrospira platensis SPKY1]|nr:hypothetical protein [Arthrospira platensis SPKY1]